MAALGVSGTVCRWIGVLAVVMALLASGTAGATGSSSPPNTAVGGGYATIAVGHVTAKGRAARLPLRCSGTPHADCFVLVVMRASRTRNQPIVGGTTVSLGVGRSATIRLPLYPNGKRLLAARHRLRVRLTVQTSRFKRIATARITFKK